MLCTATRSCRAKVTRMHTTSRSCSAGQAVITVSREQQIASQCCHRLHTQNLQSHIAHVLPAFTCFPPTPATKPHLHDLPADADVRLLALLHNVLFKVCHPLGCCPGPHSVLPLTLKQPATQQPVAESHWVFKAATPQGEPSSHTMFPLCCQHHAVP